MSYPDRTTISNWLFGRIKLKKTVKTIKEFPRIPLFSFCSFSFVLLGVISFSPGFLSSESKMAAAVNLIDQPRITGSNADANLFLSAASRGNFDTTEFLLMENSSLIAVSPTINASLQTLGIWMSEGDPTNTGQISEYIVNKEDTINSIAERFGISVNTIVWANDLKSNTLKSGQKLLILPVSGVMHVAQSGDSVTAIAKKYNASKEKILAFNYLSEDEELLEGEVLIVPGGTIRTGVSRNIAKSGSILSTNNAGGKSHAYPYGQCTWWVAQKRALPHPSLGNAKDWLRNAMARGYSVCLGSSCVPQAGAVISLIGDSVYGHVAYVESVSNGKIVVSEMNYIGWAKMDYRTIPIGSPQIKGYIY